MKNYDGMVEGQPEIYMQACEKLIPPDAVKVGGTRSFEFYVFFDQDTGEKRLGVRITSYHPGELTISRGKLNQFLDELSSDP